jgi:hypothetical protein
MALILAIEPDRRQAAQLTSLIRARVNADLVLAETAEQALHAIGDRVPDLVLVPALLAPQDDATLAGALRVIAAAARIQMLTIPVLAATSRKKQPRGVLAKWRRLRAEPAASGGCDPAMFGDQIAAYLAEAAAERANESDRAAAAPPDVSMNKVAVPSIGTAPVGEAIGVPAIEGIPALENTAALESIPELESIATLDSFPALDSIATLGSMATLEGVAVPEIGLAAIDDVRIARNTQTAAFTGVLGDLGGDELTVDEPPDELAVDVESLAPGPLPAPERQASPPVEDPRIVQAPIVEAPIAAVGSVAVDATGTDLPMAVDAISLSPDADEWETEGQEEFFLGAFHGGEPSVDEPAVYELQTDDLSLDLVFDEPPVDTPQSNRPAIDPVIDNSQLDQATQPAPLELRQPGPHGPWMPLSFGARPMWPDLEGMVAEELSVETAPVVDIALAVAPMLVEQPIAAARTAVAPAAPAAKPEWLELIDSLRRDVERLRGQRAQPPPLAVARTKQASSRTAAPVAGVTGPVSSARTPSSVVDIEAKTKKRSGSAKPAQDEWGFFDPEQCGFAALLAKLDEITHLNDGV